ncbi:MAG: hypothetical protein PHO27_12900 [Sulfuricurvum sp.]|jgi:hypothetical protein|nr:hypothetical protein [Sulfuricurvum sp.]
MSELGDRRRLFTKCVAYLLNEMLANGYEPMLGKDGLKHKKNSLHYDGLAMDIDLCKNGKYLDRTEDHQVFGVYWEGLHPDCYWGGNGPKKDGLKTDGNHYSVTMNGRK